MAKTIGMQQTLYMFVIQPHTIILMPICKVTIPVAAKPTVGKIIRNATTFFMQMLQK